MSATVIAILLGAALFVLFGLVPYRGCTGHCAGCTGSCGRHEDDQGAHHVG
ncbi:MAG: hypothetical protein ABJB33_05250 [Gemmatimonadota bacterium]